MKKTRLCTLLGIEYPIFEGGMSWISNVELAAAVSNAGGLGLLTPTSGMTGDGDLVANQKKQIQIIRGLTSKPFGVTISIFMAPQVEELVDMLISERVPVVVTSAGSPAMYTDRLKKSGIKVLHVVSAVKHAQSAEKHGVDAVIAEGYEAGGHNGMDELPTMVLIPQVVDAVKIPVVAAGGIADARGVVAAMALGADGVQMGTRFIATTECIAHPNFKEAVVKANDTDTVITCRKLGGTRILKNPLATKLVEMEAAGASIEDFLAVVGTTNLTRIGELEGDIARGQAYCGAIAGIIKEVKSAGEIIRDIVEDYDKVVAGLK